MPGPLGPDQYTELERRLLLNLRTCQARCSRCELRCGNLYDALEDVTEALVDAMMYLPQYVLLQEGTNYQDVLRMAIEALDREREA